VLSCCYRSRQWLLWFRLWFHLVNMAGNRHKWYTQYYKIQYYKIQYYAGKDKFYASHTYMCQSLTSRIFTYLTYLKLIVIFKRTSFTTPRSYFLFLQTVICTLRYQEITYFKFFSRRFFCYTISS
jgi:hypothetical protein